MNKPSLLFLSLSFGSSFAVSHQLENLKTQPVLASLTDLQQINAPVLAQDPLTGVGFSYLTPEMQLQLQNQSHAKGKCGGYEVLPSNEVQSLSSVTSELNLLRQQYLKDQSFLKGPVQYKTLSAKPSVAEAISLVQGNNLHETVSWLSSFPSRNERSDQKNAHVEAMKTKVEAWLKNWPGASKAELIDHTGTSQKSLKVTLRGTVRPEEIVILGGHHDSVASSWGGGGSQAPGADDNA
ncbi:MAG: aminopeptidase, partial [Proteobacteria bacterium]